MIPRGLTRLGLPIVFALGAACGGGDDEPRQPLAPPPVSPNLNVVGQGTLNLSVPLNELAQVAPSRIAADAGVTSPCDRLVFLFSWRSEDSKSLEFVSIGPDKNSADVGKGTEGVASVSGCVMLAATSGGDDVVEFELRYVLAETR